VSTARFSKTSGFSFVELIVVVAFMATVMGIAIPVMQDLTRSMRIGQAARTIQNELQSARLRAVTSNRPIRVRFNCPIAGELRAVELIGSTSAPASQDSATNRCSESAYPYPAADNNPVTRPNQDGPVRRIDPRVKFATVQTVEFWPDGTAHINSAGDPWPAIPDPGVSLTVTEGTVVKTVTVNSLGKIQMP
jgi:Tfp pilus assembly protein FimT